MIQDDEIDSPSLPPIALSHLVARSLSIVSGSEMQLIATLGRLDGETRDTVLVPLVDVQLHTSNMFDGDAKGTTFAASLTAENVAFLIADLSSDFAAVCENLATLSSAVARPDPQRLALLTAYLGNARERLEDAERSLNGISAA